MAIRFILENINLPKLVPQICGRRQCPPGWHIDRQAKQTYNIHYIFKGTGTFVKNGVSYTLKSGDMFISGPDDHANYTASLEDPWDYAWVSFSCAAELRALLSPDVLHNPAAGRIFSQMANSGDEPAKEWAVTGLLYQLFSILAQMQNIPPVDQGYLSKAVSYIEANYAKDIQVSHIADMMNLNRSYFCRVFKRQMGMSPQEYIVSYRLEQAERLLTTTSLSQKEIALRVGYPDVYALSRMFQRRYGIAPGKFRNNYGQKKS